MKEVCLYDADHRVQPVRARSQGNRIPITPGCANIILSTITINWGSMVTMLHDVEAVPKLVFLRQGTDQNERLLP
jgi:hypothetical protein